MNGHLRSASVGLLLASFALSNPAAAIEFTWGEIEGSFNSQISIGSSWRLENQDPQLVTPGNTDGLGLASTSTGDDGNLIRSLVPPWPDPGELLIGAIAVIVAALGLYVLTLSPDVFWGDAAQLQYLAVAREDLAALLGGWIYREAPAAGES